MRLEQAPLAARHIEQPDLAVVAGGTEGAAVRGEGDGVDRVGVAFEGMHESELDLVSGALDSPELRLPVHSTGREQAAVGIESDALNTAVPVTIINLFENLSLRHAIQAQGTAFQTHRDHPGVG